MIVTNVPRDDEAQRKVWIDPELNEIDVDKITEGGGGPIDDGFLTS